MDASASQGVAQLGKYTLVAEIARGGMGIVYLAKAAGPANFHKLVVVKQLKPELADDEKFRGMFLDEAGLAARLSHRNIVQTIAVDQDGDSYFFVMEYLEGRTLHSIARLKGEKALSVPAMLRITCDVLAGLHYAHELPDYDGKPLGIVHRDISAQNVFLTYDGQVKLLDFGVAKAEGRDQTENGALRGRVVCMAPEQVVAGPGPAAPGAEGAAATPPARIDRRADIFSVGILLRELLTGKRLWEGQSEVDVLRELLAKRIPPLPTDAFTNARIPDEVRAVIEKAMAPERDDRFRTAHAMRAALEQYVIRIDPSGSLAKVGTHISRAFAEQRAQVKATIEEHVVSAIARGRAMRELPTLVPPSAPELPNATPSSPTPNGATGPRQTGSGANPAHAKAIALPPPIPIPTAIGVPARRKRSGAAFIIGGVAVVAIAAGGAAVLLRKHPPATAVVAAQPGQPAVVASTTTTTTTPPATSETSSSSAVAIAAARAVAPAETSEMFDVHLKATPFNAQIYVDDVLSQNPWRAKYAHGSSHSIRVVAPGFTPKTETITIDGPANLTIALDRAPAVTVAAVGRAPVVQPKIARPPAAAAPEPTPVAAAPAAAAPPTPAAPAATPADVFGGGKAPKRTVDSKSPYE